MMLCNRKYCKALYTISCAIVVAFMVGYWFYKYEIEDRDIGVVDYTSLEVSEDIKFPVVSWCFEDPFVDENLRATNSNITRQTYLRYLHGEIYDDMHEQIDYENVTINLADYLMSIENKFCFSYAFSNNCALDQCPDLITLKMNMLIYGRFKLNTQKRQE